MKLIYTLLALTLIIHNLSAQSTFGQADKEFNSLAYSNASQLFEKIIKEKELTGIEKLSAQAKLGYSYRQLKDSENAERVYREMISEYRQDLPEDFINCYLYFAQALASNGKYREAQETYEKYSSFNGEDKRGTTFLKLNNNVALLTKNSGSYKVDYLSINSSAPDFSPTYYKDGLVFVSGRNEALSIKRVFNWDNSAFLDLYYLTDLNKLKTKASSSLGGSISTAPSTNKARRRSLLGSDSYTSITPNDSRLVGYFAGSAYNTNLGYEERPLTESQRFQKAINTKYHEGPASFFNDGNRVIFTRSNYNKGLYKASEDGINKLKLYSAEMLNGRWSNVTELPFNSDEFSSGHPALSPDNSLLYFVSDRPGGYGGTDIYVSKIEGNNWSTPVNLGPEINTSGNEMFPFVDARNNLYFSSDGFPGMGDLDIFYAPMESFDHAKKSINLGAPINSAKDDFGLITDGERNVGYFSSNRKEGSKDDDIYRFRRVGPMYACRDLTVIVFDQLTNKPLANSLVQLENKNLPGDIRQLRTDSTGNLLLCLAAENEFIFEASNQGYLNNTIGFNTTAFTDNRPSLVEIPLRKAEELSATNTLNPYDVKGLIVTQEGNIPLAGVKVAVKDEVDGSVQEIVTDDSGSYIFRAISGHNYKIDAELKDFGTFGREIIGFDSNRLPNLKVQMFEKGDLVKIENIYYDLNSYEIRVDAANELNKVLDILTKYPGMKIELGSHTDSRASAHYNKILSNNRAKAAKEYLISKGINAKRISTKGYGESKLTNECEDGSDCTEEEHQKNRRTEIRIMDLQK